MENQRDDRPRTPARVLHALINDRGRIVCNDPSQCEALLRGMCPNASHEVKIIIDTLKHLIEGRFVMSLGQLSWKTVSERVGQRLVEQRVMPAEVAEWALTVWGIAFGELSTERLQPAPALPAAAPLLAAPATDDIPFVQLLEEDEPVLPAEEIPIVEPLEEEAPP